MARGAASIGPGLVFLLSVVGPQDLITNSIAGATQGYGLIWILVLASAARFLFLEATARYVIVTGESIAAGCGRVGKWMVWLVFLTPLIKRHLAGLTQVLLLGVAAHSILPLPTRHSVAIWGALSWALAFVLLFWGRYRRIERFGRVMAVVFGGCLAAAAIMAGPRPGDVLRGALTPALPDEVNLYGSVMVVMAILGSAVGSISNLRYAAFVHEKGWREVAFLRRQRFDMLLSVSGMFVMLVAIQVAAAGALRPAGLKLERVEDLIPIFSLVLGDAGRIVFAAGLWSATFNYHVGGSAGHGLMLADIYHRYLRPSAVIAEQDTGRGAAYLPAYRWFLLYFCLAPLYVVLTDWTPMWLVLINSAGNVVLLPVIIVALMRLTAGKSILGRYANGWFVNAAMGLALAGALWLAGQGAAELFAKLTGGG